MKPGDIAAIAIGYVLIGTIVNLLCIDTWVLHGYWVRKRRTPEARAVAGIITNLFWGIIVPIMCLAPVWRGIKFLGRGFRDLLPERKAKLPKARIV